MSKFYITKDSTYNINTLESKNKAYNGFYIFKSKKITIMRLWILYGIKI